MTRLAMLSSCGLASVALVAGLAGAPAMAQQDQTQTQMQNRQGEMQQPSQEGRACLDRLEQLDQRLAGAGYGQPGPRGYGAYGTAYRTMAPAATDGAGTSAALTRPLRTTPRADMHALMRAGFVMAQTGYDQGCQQVAAAVEDMAKRYETAMRSGECRPRRNGAVARDLPL
ncbi:hypothetical protein [Pelagibius sp. 7325]|uniref:hypothetical protein n=1 Tax=Pelagibius sp. 7325 TaxID=3131994 RepID=UPI0030EE78A4